MKHLLTIVIVMLCVTAFADDPPDTLYIPQLEIFSAKPEHPAGMVSIQIDTLVLQNERAVSMSDLLDAHSTVFIKNEGRGALSTVSFRGTAASHTDVLWNGMSIRSPMLGQVDFSLLPVFLFDDVTLKPGNSTLSETSGALGGAVLLKTKANGSQPFSLDFLTSAGSYSTFNNFIKIGIAGKSVNSDTRVYDIQSKNDFSFKNKNIATLNPETGAYDYPVVKNEHAGYHIYGIQQFFNLNLHKNGLLTAVYWYQNTQRSLPRLNTYEGDDYSNINKQFESVHRGNVRYTYLGEKGKLTVSSGFTFKKMQYLVQNLISGQGFVYASNAFSKIFSSYNHAGYRYALSEKQSIEIGYDFDYHSVATLDSVRLTGYDKIRREHKAMISWNGKWTERFSTAVLVRKERAGGVSLPLIGYAGFTWLAGKKSNWTINGNIARNVRYPGLNDLYWQPGGNPALKPEEGISAEASAEYQTGRGNLLFYPQIQIFYNNINNWILWLPAPAGYWQAQNVEKVVAKGLSFGFKSKARWKKVTVALNGNYAFTRSLNFGNPEKWGDDAVGKQLPYIPVHSGNIMISLLWKGFKLDYVNNSYSERYTTSTNNLTRRDWLYPYFMNNLYLSKDFGIKKADFSLQLKIYNLFNEEYRSVLGRPMPGRNYLLQLTIHLK